jgi:hypothetical protein
MSAPETHLCHFMKEDLGLLRVVDNFILLRFKFSQGRGEPCVECSQSAGCEERVGFSYGAQQYHWPGMYPTFGRKTGRVTSSVVTLQRSNGVTGI